MNLRSGGQLTKSLMSFFDVVKTHNKGTLKTLLASLNQLPMLFKKTKAGATDAGTGMAVMGAGATGGATGVKTLTGSLMALWSALWPVVVVIGGLTVAFKAIEAVVDSNSGFQKKYAEDVDTTTDKVTELKEELKLLNEQMNRTDAEEQRLKLLQKELEIQENLLKVQKEKEFASKFKGDVGFLDKAGANLGRWDISRVPEGSVTPEMKLMEAEYFAEVGKGTESMKMRTEAVKDLTAENEKLIREQLTLSGTEEEIAEQFQESKEQIADNNQVILEAQNANLELINLLDERIATGEKLTEQEQAQYDASKQALDIQLVQADATTSFADSLAELGNAGEQVVNVYETMEQSMSLVSTAMKEMDSDGQLSIETVMKMIESGGDLIDMLYLEDGVYKLRADSAEIMFQKQKANAIAEVQMQKAKTQSLIDGLKIEISAYEASAQGAVGYSTTAGNAVIGIAQAIVSSTQAMQMGLSGVVVSAAKSIADSLRTASSSISKITNPQELALAKNTLIDAESQMKQYDAMLDVLANVTSAQMAGTAGTVNDKIKEQGKEATGTAGAIKDKYSEAIKENEKLQKSLDKQIKATNDAINAQKKAFEDKEHAYDVFVKEAIKILEKEIDLLEKQKDAREEFYDNEIDKIKDKISLLDEEKKKEDDLAKLEEARLDIIKKRQALEDIRKNKNVKTYKEGEGWTWGIDKKSEKEAMDAVEEAMKAFKELEKQWNITQQKLELEEQVKALEKAKEENIKNLEEQIKKLEEFKDQWSESMDIKEDISKYEGMLEGLERFEKGSFATREEMLKSFTKTWTQEADTHNKVLASMTSALEDLERQATQAKEEADRLREASDNAKASADRAKNAANEASSAIRDFNNTPVNNKPVHISKTEYIVVQEDGYLYSVTVVDGTPVYPRKLLGKIPGGKAGSTVMDGALGALEAIKGLNKYAKGGVTTQFNGDELIDYTGQYRGGGGGGFLDGSTQKPEVVVSNDSATWLHRMLTSRIAPEVSQNVTNADNSKTDTYTIENLTVKADSNSTVESILQQAYSMAKHKV